MKLKLRAFERDPRAGQPVSPDYPLFAIMLAILGMGLFMVLDASYARASQNGLTHGDPYFFFRSQVRYAVMGLVALVIAMQARYWKLHRYGSLALLVSIAALVLVMFVGVHSHGAARWLRLGPVQLQPSELAKVCVALYLSAYISRRQRSLRNHWGALIGALGPVIIVGVLIIKEPDLGTAMTLVVTAFVMLAVGGANCKRLFAVAAVGAILVFIQAYRNPYSHQRLASFTNSSATDKTYSYQVNQSVLALQAGGFKGLGPGQGDAKFFHLPAPYTDFIAATLGEEFGLIGSLVLLGLFFSFTVRGYLIAHRCPNVYGTLLATGLCTMVTVQALLNLAVITRTFPDTGVPLPMVSFGGSSLVLVMFATGLLLSISRWPELTHTDLISTQPRSVNRRVTPSCRPKELQVMDTDVREAVVL